MNATAGTLAVDPGLLARYRAAGAKIVWRDGPTPRPGRALRRWRIAHLHDEEARVEESGSARARRITVDSGPLGALVLLLEIDRRGLPSAVGGREAGHDPGFPGGVIEAAWGGGTVVADSFPTVKDLVELARYALA